MALQQHDCIGQNGEPVGWGRSMVEKDSNVHAGLRILRGARFGVAMAEEDVPKARRLHGWDKWGKREREEQELRFIVSRAAEWVIALTWRHPRWVAEALDASYALREDGDIQRELHTKVSEEALEAVNEGKARSVAHAIMAFVTRYKLKMPPFNAHPAPKPMRTREFLEYVGPMMFALAATVALNHEGIAERCVDRLCFGLFEEGYSDTDWEEFRHEMYGLLKHTLDLHVEVSRAEEAQWRERAK